MPFLYKVSYRGERKLVEANFPHQALKKAFPGFKFEAGLRTNAAPLTFVYSGRTEEEGHAVVEEQEEWLT